MTGRWIRSRAAPTGRLLVLRPEGPARPRRCSTATAMPTASAWRMTASRCSSPKAGPAACIATGWRGRRPAPPNASSATCRAIPTTSTAPPTAITGWPGSACARRASTCRCAIPAMRKRMTRRLPQDEWLFPNINTGGVVKFDESGRIVETLGDLTGVAHPMVTSMREHKGYLYRRRHPQQPHRPLSAGRRRSRLDGPRLLLGGEAMILDPVLDLFRGRAVTIPPMDGAFRPNTASTMRRSCAAARRAGQSGFRRWQAALPAAAIAVLARLGAAEPDARRRLRLLR